MASNGYIRLEGLDDLMRTFDDIPKQIQKAGIQGAARKASKPLIENARSKLSEISASKSVGTLNPADNQDQSTFSKLKYASRYIKAIAKQASSYAPGVRVLFKGPDVPMNGGKKFYNIQGYIKLMAAGSYKVGKRSTLSGKNTGEFKGFDNFVRNAYQDVSGMVDSIFAKNLFLEVEKALKRAARRKAKKLR